MKPVKPPPEIPTLLCPECGSDKTEKIDQTLKDSASKEIYNKYKCNNCECEFFPAMESVDTNISKWAFKNNIVNNTGESIFAKNNRYFIIENTTPLPQVDLMGEICSIFVAVTGHQSDSKEYADFVNGIRSSKYLSTFMDKGNK
jgi:hypothetical protein